MSLINFRVCRQTSCCTISPNSPEQGVALNMLRATPCSGELGEDSVVFRYLYTV